MVADRWGLVLPCRRDVHVMIDSMLIRIQRHAPALAACVLILVVVGGCRQQTPANAAAQSPAESPATAPTAAPTDATSRIARVFSDNIPTKPNPRLPTLRLFVGVHELQTEIALTELQIQTGMMFRTNIAENEAMLFVFNSPHQVGFWMKNVPINLSCAYLDPEGVIVETHDMYAGVERPIESASDRIQYVLETSHGWFERNGIKPGVLIRTEHGSLGETFFRTRRP